MWQRVILKFPSRTPVLQDHWKWFPVHWTLWVVWSQLFSTHHASKSNMQLQMMDWKCCTIPQRNMGNNNDSAIASGTLNCSHCGLEWCPLLLVLLWTQGTQGRAKSKQMVCHGPQVTSHKSKGPTAWIYCSLQSSDPGQACSLATARSTSATASECLADWQYQSWHRVVYFTKTVIWKKNMSNTLDLGTLGVVWNGKLKMRSRSFC